MRVKSLTKFRHGFKAQCEKRSLELRNRLNLTETSPLSAFRVAEFFGATIWSLKEIKELSDEHYDQLTQEARNDWSAFTTLPIKERRLIVYNPNASDARINSVCMHEMSHIILNHKMTQASTSTDGHLILGQYEKAEEDEANWLAGALLLPRPAALNIRINMLSKEDAMKQFLVSEEMLQWRIRMTGVDYQLNKKKTF